MGFEGETIISEMCPSGFCCQLSECNYIDDSDNLCELFRDTSSILCSECIDGYSESVNSAQCVKCKEGAIHWEYLALPGIMALLMTGFILFTNTDKVKDEPKDEEEEEATLERATTMKAHLIDNVKSDNTKLMLASMAKIVIYYEQVE